MHRSISEWIHNSMAPLGWDESLEVILVKCSGSLGACFCYLYFALGAFILLVVSHTVNRLIFHIHPQDVL